MLWVTPFRQLVVVGSSQTGWDTSTEAMLQDLGLNVKMAAILLAMVPLVAFAQVQRTVRGLFVSKTISII
jgi:hypothetical protein